LEIKKKTAQEDIKGGSCFGTRENHGFGEPGAQTRSRFGEGEHAKQYVRLKRAATVCTTATSIEKKLRSNVGKYETLSFVFFLCCLFL